MLLFRKFTTVTMFVPLPARLTSENGSMRTIGWFVALLKFVDFFWG